uniref:Kinesin motor domain-containing protein n=1 Tax=Globisporangium ultimum (strain ATCC 200006 / CBS 805.95 / DAOM BR144) TaxID=431595 RepID=K3X4B8_GLOUD
MDHKVTTDYTRLLANANVKVYVRARPCADGQKPPEDMFERNRDTQKNIVIKNTESMQYGNHAFSFDHIYWTDTSQATLFETTSKPLVDYALKGINSCCFAYGQTGSGKTFSFVYLVRCAKLCAQHFW